MTKNKKEYCYYIPFTSTTNKNLAELFPTGTIIINKENKPTVKVKNQTETIGTDNIQYIYYVLTEQSAKKKLNF